MLMNQKKQRMRNLSIKKLKNDGLIFGKKLKKEERICMQITH